MESTQCRLVTLISGTGSNLQALINAGEHSPYSISGVISNKADAGGLKIAERCGIPTAILEHRKFAERAAFDQALRNLIDDFSPDLVVLAGFMRILTANFVRHYAGRLLNIHPSLLPKHPGLNTHQRVLDAGDGEHGASVHFVTEELDGGPVIAQDRLPVLPDDDAAKLAARVLEKEHLLYPKVVSWFAEGRLKLEGNQALLDGSVLPPGGAPTHV